MVEATATMVAHLAARAEPQAEGGRKRSCTPRRASKRRGARKSRRRMRGAGSRRQSRPRRAWCTDRRCSGGDAR
eukprot:632253-Prymnesium_polylepis.1